MPELLDKNGTIQLVSEIKAEVDGITGSMAKIFKGTSSNPIKIVAGDAAWSGEEPPYTQRVVVAGMLESDDPIVDMVPDNTYATAGRQIDAWSEIYRIDARENAVIVYAHRKTTEDIPIKIVCIRPITV